MRYVDFDVNILNAISSFIYIMELVGMFEFDYNRMHSTILVLGLNTSKFEWLN